MRWLLAVVSIATLITSSNAQQAGRYRPPDLLQCDRNHLTSFTGEVMTYKRTANTIRLKLHTDEDTNEQFTIKRAHQSIEQQMMVDQDRFQSGDWTKIEKAKGRLLPRMRATVWICEQPKQLVVDWHPPAK